MTEKLVLIILMHENTPYFLIFPLFAAYDAAPTYNYFKVGFWKIKYLIASEYSKSAVS